MNSSVNVSAAQEDYLETIYRLDEEKGAARVRDIAKRLSVHKSTVTAALKALAEKGLVNYSPYELTTLSALGLKRAKEVAGRHRTIQRFLTEVLLIEENQARKNACRMEHVMDNEVLQRLVAFAEFVKAYPPHADVSRKTPPPSKSRSRDPLGHVLRHFREIIS